MQDKAFSMIDFTREQFIDWLVETKGYSEEDAEEMANIMGY